MSEIEFPKASSGVFHHVRRVVKGVLFSPVDAVVDFVETTRDGITKWPMAVWRGSKEDRLAFLSATEYERTIDRWARLGWLGVFGVACLAFFLTHGTVMAPVGAFLAILLGVGWFLARMKLWDPMRTYVEARLSGSLAAEPKDASTPRMSTALAQEIAAARCERALETLRAWRKEPALARGPVAPVALLKVIDILSGSGSDLGAIKASIPSPQDPEPPSTSSVLPEVTHASV